LNKSTVILSFDVEREFGFVDVPDHPTRLAILKNPGDYDTHLRVMVSLLDKYEVPATLAIVGKLFERTGTVIDLVEKARYNHDIGSHGYSHHKYGQMDQSQAVTDVLMGSGTLKAYGINPVSFVFPSDDINHLHILEDGDFKVFRGKTSTMGHPMLNRLIPKVCKPFTQKGMVCIPGSLFYHNSGYAKINLWQAKRGIDNVVNKGGVYHIWVHPHNLLLGYNHLEYFGKLLHYMALRRNRGELEVMTMKEYAEEV